MTGTFCTGFVRSERIFLRTKNARPKTDPIFFWPCGRDGFRANTCRKCAASGKSTLFANSRTPERFPNNLDMASNPRCSRVLFVAKTLILFVQGLFCIYNYLHQKLTKKNTWWYNREPKHFLKLLKILNCATFPLRRKSESTRIEVRPLTVKSNHGPLFYHREKSKRQKNTPWELKDKNPLLLSSPLEDQTPEVAS